MRAILLAAALLSAAAPLAAQGSPFHLDLIPRAGFIRQTAPFRQRFQADATRTETWRYRYADDWTLGMAAELFSDRFPVGLRVEASHATRLSLSREGDLGPNFMGEPTAAMTVATAAVVAQPRAACVGSVCPRLVAGVGYKWYQFDALVNGGDVVSPLAEDQGQLTLQLGAGLTARVAGISILAEVNDYSNEIDYFYALGDGRVHDTVASIGLVFRIP